MSFRNFKGTIKTTTSKHSCNASVSIIKCLTLRDGVLVVKNNGFLHLKIERGTK